MGQNHFNSFSRKLSGDRYGASDAVFANIDAVALQYLYICDQEAHFYFLNDIDFCFLFLFKKCSALVLINFELDCSERVKGHN